MNGISPNIAFINVKFNTHFFCCIFNLGNIFCRKRTLICIIQNISFFVCMLLCTFLEFRFSQTEDTKAERRYCFHHIPKSLYILKIQGLQETIFFAEDKIQKPFFPFFCIRNILFNLFLHFLYP